MLKRIWQALKRLPSKLKPAARIVGSALALVLLLAAVGIALLEARSADLRFEIRGLALPPPVTKLSNPDLPHFQPLTQPGHLPPAPPSGILKVKTAGPLAGAPGRADQPRGSFIFKEKKTMATEAQRKPVARISVLRSAAFALSRNSLRQSQNFQIPISHISNHLPSRATFHPHLATVS